MRQAQAVPFRHAMGPDPGCRREPAVHRSRQGPWPAGQRRTGQLPRPGVQGSARRGRQPWHPGKEMPGRDGPPRCRWEQAPAVELVLLWRRLLLRRPPVLMRHRRRPASPPRRRRLERCRLERRCLVARPPGHRGAELLAPERGPRGRRGAELLAPEPGPRGRPGTELLDPEPGPRGRRPADRRREPVPQGPPPAEQHREPESQGPPRARLPAG